MNGPFAAEDFDTVGSWRDENGDWSECHRSKELAASIANDKMREWARCSKMESGHQWQESSDLCAYCGLPLIVIAGGGR